MRSFCLQFLISLLVICPARASWALAATSELTVSIENMKFTPSPLEVKRGQTVIWVNKDLVPHTVTSLKKKFDSKVIEPGKSWKHRFRRVGSFDYKCDLHPTMQGQILVTAP